MRDSEEKNLAPIQSLWIGERVSKLEQLCMKSFMAHGHDFHLYAYNDIQSVPQGVIVKDANEIIPEDQIHAYPAKELAARADWFRWELVAKKGGWWVDMDVVCLKPFDLPQDIVAMETETCVFKFPANHIVAQSLAYHARNPDLSIPWLSRKYNLRKFLRRRLGFRMIPYGQREIVGPKSYARALVYFGETDHLLPNKTFTSVRDEGDGSFKFFDSDPENRAILEGSYSIHFYNAWAERVESQ